ncbi:hypothetical protein ACQKWADRAFT_296818 [Trichoderma austrokoningii]
MCRIRKSETKNCKKQIVHSSHRPKKPRPRMRRPPPRRRPIAASLRAATAAAAAQLPARRRPLELSELLLIDAYDLLLLSSRISRGFCDDAVIVIELRSRRSRRHAERAIHFVLRNDRSRLSQSSKAR